MDEATSALDVSVQKQVVEGFAAVLGSLDKHFQVVDNLLLTGETVEMAWPQGAFHFAFLAALALAGGV